MNLMRLFLRVVIVKTISFSTISYQICFERVFIYLFIFSFWNWNKYLNKSMGRGTKRKNVCAKALHALMELWIFIVIILVLWHSFTVIAVFIYEEEEKNVRLRTNTHIIHVAFFLKCICATIRVSLFLIKVIV